MDSLAPSHLTSSTPATHIYWCLNAFLSYLFSIESAAARLHCMHTYVTSLLREIRTRRGDTVENLEKKIKICDGIAHLIDKITATREAVQSRSRQYAGVTGINFPYGYSHGTGKDFEMGVGSQQGIGLNRFMGQAKGNYPEVKPTIININLVASAGTNINHVSFVQEAKDYNCPSDDANQPGPKASQQHTQRPKRISWTRGLKLKFENAVAMLGGLKWATAKRIWRLMNDDTLTIRQVSSYLQRYRDERKRIEEMYKPRHP